MPLQRLHTRSRRTKIVLEQPVQRIHQRNFQGPPRNTPLLRFMIDRCPIAPKNLQHKSFLKLVSLCKQFLAFFLPDSFGAPPRSYNRNVPRKSHESRRSEQRNPASKNLDRLSALQIVQLMNREDRKVALAVGRSLPGIARAVDVIVDAMRQGGRLIYAGAGTSGRLAVLDAAEIPPTFGTSPPLVRALIAGGRAAITTSVEGAEDSPGSAQHDLRAIKLNAKDVVTGICASGTTPYVLGALKYAREKGAQTIAITVNRNSPVARLVQILIATDVGPEVLTGSTRLKAGTAQKMVLNMLTTAAMARLGHVYENLMIDVSPTNKKLSGRIVRILSDASGANASAATHALRQSGHNLRIALIMLKLKLTADQAGVTLRQAKGNLRAALGE
jgi:N-acetylmuramic acid 6-phosphate etherase